MLEEERKMGVERSPFGSVLVLLLGLFSGLIVGMVLAEKRYFDKLLDNKRTHKIDRQNLVDEEAGEA